MIFLALSAGFCQEASLSTGCFMLSCVVVKPKDYISLSSETVKLNIERIIKEIYSKNYNSVAFVVKENGFVVYKTTFAPQLRLKDKDFSYFDILSFAYGEAKKYGLGFFVVFEVFKTTSPLEVEWLCRTKDNKIFSPYYLSCGNPEVQLYLRNFLEEFLKNYSFVDGVFLDEVKYPSKNTSYDVASLERFYGRGNPKLLEWEDFQRDQLNKFVCDCYCLIKSIKKDCLVGVVTDEVYKDSFSLCGVFYENYQDPLFWAQNKFCDVVVAKFSGNNFESAFKKFNYWFSKEKVFVYVNNKVSFNFLKNSKNIYGFVCDYGLNLSSFPFRSSVPVFGFENRVVCGRVLDEKNSPLLDAWVSLNLSDRKNFFTFSSIDGFFSFCNVLENKVSLRINYPYCDEVFFEKEINEDINLFEPVSVSSASFEKDKLFVYILKPKSFKEVSSNLIHILARTHPKNYVEFHAENFSIAPKVFRSGIFAVDNVKLKPGINELKFKISDAKKTSTYDFTVLYSTTPTYKETGAEMIGFSSVSFKNGDVLWLLDEKDFLLFSGDFLELKIKTTPEREVFAVCFEDSSLKIKLEEIDSGVYYSIFKIPENFSSKKTKVKFEIVEKKIKKFLFYKKEKIKINHFESDVFVEVWNSAYPLLGVTSSKNTPVSYSIYRQRLGGPYAAELPKGVKLQIVGKKQNNYRVKLSNYLSGWVETKNIELLREEKKPVENSVLSCVVSSYGNKTDKITVSMLQPVAFSVQAVAEEKNYLVVDIFNSSLAANWIQNLAESDVIEKIKTEQFEDGWVKIYIFLKTKQNWGFWYEMVGSNLVLYINHPPKISKKNPLYNFKVAIEAGHGGEGNTGAVGLSGTKEKNLNLKATYILKEVFEKEKAKVILLRQGDTNPNFEQRLNEAYENEASLIISIHANAANTDKGFLSSAEGPSVYYKHDNCKKLAELVHEKLKTIWKKDYGIVSNFNYAVVRQSRVPAILVEMGFLTHPEDEAFLIDEGFLYKQAYAIVEAVNSFLRMFSE